MSRVVSLARRSASSSGGRVASSLRNAEGVRYQSPGQRPGSGGSQAPSPERAPSDEGVSPAPSCPRDGGSPNLATLDVADGGPSLDSTPVQAPKSGPSLDLTTPQPLKSGPSLDLTTPQPLKSGPSLDLTTPQPLKSGPSFDSTTLQPLKSGPSFDSTVQNRRRAGNGDACRPHEASRRGQDPR